MRVPLPRERRSHSEVLRCRIMEAYPVYTVWRRIEQTGGVGGCHSPGCALQMSLSRVRTSSSIGWVGWRKLQPVAVLSGPERDARACTEGRKRPRRPLVLLAPKGGKAVNRGSRRCALRPEPHAHTLHTRTHKDERNIIHSASCAYPVGARRKRS